MTGKHRKASPLVIALRTTGGVLAGAAVLGGAAVTAHAEVIGPDKPDSPAAAAMRAPVGTSAGKAPKAAKAAEDADAAKGKPAGKSSRKPTAEEAIKVARSQVGVEEDGSGKTKFQEWYMSTSRAKETVKRDGGSIKGYSEAQWCDMFVSWVGEQIGFTDQMGMDAWTVAHAEWFKKHDRWGDKPKPGAIVFYSWGGGESIDDIVHVGMVIKDKGDGTVRTVEGNTGNAVKVRTRSTGDIVGYGYPEYSG